MFIMHRFFTIEQVEKHHHCNVTEIGRPGFLGYSGCVGLCFITPWKTNMEHNHGGLEDHFPPKWVICRFHVNLSGCNPVASSPVWKSKLGVSSFLARGLCFIMFFWLKGIAWFGRAGVETTGTMVEMIWLLENNRTHTVIFLCIYTYSLQTLLFFGVTEKNRFFFLKTWFFRIHGFQRRWSHELI